MEEIRKGVVRNRRPVRTDEQKRQAATWIADYYRRNPAKRAEKNEKACLRSYLKKQSLACLVTRLFRSNVEAVIAVKREIEEGNIDQRGRAQLRANAISFLGGRCAWCGHDDMLCLQLDHIKPVKRRTNGIKAHDSAAFCREILSGKTDNAQVLCANCHMVKTRLGGEYGAADALPFDPWAGLDDDGDTGTASNDNIRSETVTLQIGAIAA